MFQWALIDSNICAKRDIVWNSVKASFTEIQDNTYEVLLEVSSNKFLVNMITDAAWIIQWFEIVAVKWFMELSKRVIEVVKNYLFSYDFLHNPWLSKILFQLSNNDSELCKFKLELWINSSNSK